MPFSVCVCVEKLLFLFIIRIRPVVPLATFVGKQSQNHVCGPQGHEDEDRDLSTTSNDVLEVPDVVVKLSDATSLDLWFCRSGR